MSGYPMETINVNVADPLYGIQMGIQGLRVHNQALCAEDPSCCIHKPSRHPLAGARMNWRGDRGLMERVCVHGVGHPDPDDLAYKRATMGTEYERYAFDIHGCDGCCRGNA